MKKRTAIILAAVGFFSPQLALAQGTVYVSNLGEPLAGNAAVGSDSWFAGVVRTGFSPGGYDLISVQLLTDTASGSPNSFSVFLYDKGVGGPGNSLGSLSGFDPAAGGVFTYVASGITLLPYSNYYVVVTAATPVADGSYYWRLANTGNFSSNDGWAIGSGYFSSADGSSWYVHRDSPFQFAVYASVVPEPTTSALSGLGLAALSFWRFRQRK